MHRDLRDFGSQILIWILPKESALKIRSFDAPWSVWSWITNPNPDPPKGTRPKDPFLWCNVIYVILDHKS